MMTEKTPKRPRPGTITAAVLDVWERADACKPAGQISWCWAEEAYMRRSDELRQTGKIKGSWGRCTRGHAAMNIKRILEKFGYKSGPSGSKAPWILGRKPDHTCGGCVATPTPAPPTFDPMLKVCVHPSTVEALVELVKKSYPLDAWAKSFISGLSQAQKQALEHALLHE